jgi:hypothetical protein
MPTKCRNQFFGATLVLIAASALLAACGPLKKRATIDVEFTDSVKGLHQGDSVYLLGVPVGETGSPFAANNRAIVPVVLFDAGVFGERSQVLFLLSPDQTKRDRQCLIAYVAQGFPASGQTRFRGFVSRLALSIELESKSVESWWKGLAQ